MNTDVVYVSKEISVGVPCVTTRIKGIILKIVKASSFDAEAIFKSKDWPYLWKK
jgi:hypothetical protein